MNDAIASLRNLGRDAKETRPILARQAGLISYMLKAADYPFSMAAAIHSGLDTLAPFEKFLEEDKDGVKLERPTELSNTACRAVTALLRLADTLTQID
jgi:hypothetical protein